MSVDEPYPDQGRNWVILRGGRRYICNGKNEILHGLSSGEKIVVAPGPRILLSLLVNQHQQFIFLGISLGDYKSSISDYRPLVCRSKVRPV